jgi:flavin-dependent dehydrogenase
MARQLGAKRASRFDRLIAYQAKLLCAWDAEAEASTYVLADREGWWFIGPRHGDATSALFFTDSDLIGRTGLGKIAASWARVRASLFQPAYLAEITAPHLAHSEALEQPWGAGWLAIGDAAAAFDPLSSSGLYFSQASAEWASLAILSGDFLAYGEAVSGYIDGFLASRRRVYNGEQRFADHAFWQRRQRGTHPPTADLLERERMQ